MKQLLDTSVVSGPLLIGLYLLSGMVAAALCVRRAGTRRTLVAWAVVGGGGAFGWALVWVVSDVWDVFGVAMSVGTRWWAAAVFAGLALATVTVVGSRRWRRAAAIAALPLFLLTAAAGINADVGQFPTLRTALGLPVFGSLASTVSPAAGAGAGTVGTVTIPATVSGFAARTALVYLPPAALTPDPPALPVVEMLSGQPGSPSDVFTSGRLAAIMDAFAASHSGLAPIVVVPDQLGAADRNPMCVDSALGNSATYLTVDVPAWIRSRFRVAPAPTGWTIAGFSEGGTCSIQLGAAHPELFGTVLDISGELAPKSGSPARTIQAGFGGSAAAYASAAPSAILAADAPYTALRVIFAVGAGDARFLAWAQTLDAAAKRAGATTDLIVSPGTAHDWRTVGYAWTKALPIIAERSGLTGHGGLAVSAALDQLPAAR